MLTPDPDTTQETEETRTPNNVLTAAEMFRLTRAIDQRVIQQKSGEVHRLESWKLAEVEFGARIGRPVTRPNIITALSALDDVTQSEVVKPRGVEKPAESDVDNKIESLDGRVGRLANDVTRLATRLDGFVVSTAERRRSLDESLDESLDGIAAAVSAIERRSTRLEQRVDQFEQPFKLNSGGELAEQQGETAATGAGS
jgi:chaperonin cofactor prefoldin